MNESNDRVLADWLDEGPERGPREGLERALAATRRVGQRPGWTLPERWIPMQLTMARTRSQRPILTIATLALLMVALVATALFIGSRRQSLPLYRNGAIVYAQDGDLFIADQLNGTPRTLIAGPEMDSDPVFSDQGDRVAFVREAPDGFVSRIMTVRPDGSDVRELAGLESISVRLAWTPDGTALIASGNGTYVRSADGEAVMGVGPDSRRLSVFKSDGSGSRMLDAGPGVTAGPASWRPDGRHIAFLGWQENGHVPGLYIADADGTNVHRLPIDPSIRSDSPKWAPGGTQLSFTSGGPDGISLVTVADIDANGRMTGSHQLPLDLELSAKSAPVWAPNGSHLAFVVWEGSEFRVGVFEPDGSGYRFVGPALADPGEAEVVWSPDGLSLVITGQVLEKDPNTQIHRWTEKTWSVDVGTGAQTEVQTPVASWQRLAP